MRVSHPSAAVHSARHSSTAALAAALIVFGAVAAQVAPAALAQQKPPPQESRLPQPHSLGRGIELRRDPASGELRSVPAKAAAPGMTAGTLAAAGLPAATLRARVNLVEVSCNVLAADGTQVRGLGLDDFRVYEDGVSQTVAHFDASSEPASIALVIDASPSIFRELEAIKAAAHTLAANLAPPDEVAVVVFAREVRLLLPFSRDRALLGRALGSRELARVANSSESNIYLAVYLTAKELFAGRTGRKVIVLLTDGQDSGLGLNWDPASAVPNSGAKADRLTFEDVARELAAAGVELHVVSTEPRPKQMTGAWLAAHRNEVLVTPEARELGMAHYTLYLAEMVRRAGGQLYFLREIGTLSEVYRRIAETLGAQYALGYYPTAGAGKPGWRVLRVDLGDRSDATATLRGVRVVHRAVYYVPASP